MFQLWMTRLTTFLLWALAVGSGAFWALQNVNGAALNSTSPPAAAPLASADQNLTPQVALALGAKTPVLPTAASNLAALQARFQLLGVLASGKGGAALIALDGKPAKPYRVGVVIEDGLEVRSVKARSAVIGTKTAEAFTLELAKELSGLESNLDLEE
jgi:general secretion pathway protein C